MEIKDCETKPRSLSDIYEKFETHSFLPLTCPIFTQCIIDKTYSQVTKRKKTPIELEESSSALENAQEILNNVLENVFQDVAPKKEKKMPTLKNHLRDVIPNFEIDEETFNDLLFRENLLISKIEDNCATPVGALSLSIQSARGGPLLYQKEKTKSDYTYPKFLLHLSSQFDYGGHNGGSRIMAWIDRDLQTLEETRTEFIHLKDANEQEKLYINSQPDFYYLRHNKINDVYYSLDKAKYLICEGSNFLLMRYLAIKRFIGTFEVSTVYINGDLCRNIYICHGPMSGLVYKQKLDVCKMERLIIEKCGLRHTSIILLTLGGRILKQEWSSCDYILQVNPTLFPLGDKPTPAERIPLELNFMNDLQMYSLYLDEKTINKKKIDSYFNDYPEIKNHIADYVETILHLKPENVFEFTAKYFLGFAPQLLPFTEYFERKVEDEEDDNEDDEYDFARF